MVNREGCFPLPRMPDVLVCGFGRYPPPSCHRLGLAVAVEDGLVVLEGWRETADVFLVGIVENGIYVLLWC